MRRLKLVLFLMIPIISFAQKEMISADFDGDKITDKVYVDESGGTVIYELSTQKFKKVSTEDFRDNGEIFLNPSKNGFRVELNRMRSGNYYQFRYEKSTGKMQLIGMQRYEFGPANNDGSGESSVNLLTNSYIADWNYYDLDKSELIKIPTIRKKMVLPKTYFEQAIRTFSIYEDNDYKYYNAEKNRMIRGRK